LEAYNNVFFGNDLAQVHFRKGGAGAVGFNTILATEKQGPPFPPRNETSPPPRLCAPNSRISMRARRCACEARRRSAAMARQLLKTNAVSRRAGLRPARRSGQGSCGGIGKPAATVPQAPYDPSGGLQLPLPKALPGIVEFENYDVGGPERLVFRHHADKRGRPLPQGRVDIKASAEGRQTAPSSATRKTTSGWNTP
jgi:hypothetical protein